MKFLRAIIKAVQDGNVQSFEDEIYKLNSRMTLDKQRESMLIEIKSKLKGKGVEPMGEDYNPF